MRADRLAHWQRRLTEPSSHDVGVLALRDDTPVGFAFAIRDESGLWGSMLHNIHVLPQAQGLGIGRGLIRELVAQLVRAGCTSGLHLGVYDANRDARRFYERLGGKVLRTEVVVTAGAGLALAHVYGWASLRELHELLQAAPTNFRDGGRRPAHSAQART